MTTKTDIANGAAVKLGVQRLSTLSDPSELARVVDLVFDRVVRAELRKNAWSFSLTSTSIGRTTDPTGGQFKAAFILPTDLIRLVQFNDDWTVYGLSPVTDGLSQPFLIEGRTLLTNDLTVRIRYVRDLSGNTSLWDPAFVEAVTCRLAVEMAATLTKDKQKARDCETAYRMALAEAKRTNGIELPPTERPDSAWVVSRFTRG
jgi:hypothetical protein